MTQAQGGKEAESSGRQEGVVRGEVQWSGVECQLRSLRL